MNRSQLEAVHDALVEIIDGWNSSAADDDRGPSNDTICLTLGDDGAGFIGRRSAGQDTVEDWHTFKDLDELVSVLKDEGVEFD